MTDFREKYKQKGLSFGDLQRSRITRASERDERRKEIRAQNFSKLRPLAQIEKTGTPGPSAATISRNEKLQKWKQDKAMKKKTEKEVVKPPFKVGVVHHRAFSPPISGSSGPTCSHSNSYSSIKSKLKQQPGSIKGITKVTEKRLAAKAAARAAAIAAEKKSFAPPNYKFKAPAGLPNIPLFGRVKKGSIDATKLSWNLSTEKDTAIKSEVRNSLSSQRRKSDTIVRESPRKNKKLKTSHKEDESMNSNSLKEDQPRLSGPDKRRASNSSIDSMSLRVSSDDDPEVFDSPVAESSHINVDIQKKESTMKEVIVTSTKPDDQISPLEDNKKSPVKLHFLSPTKKNPESSLEENNDPVLEVNTLQENDTKDEVNSVEKTDEAPEIHTETEVEKMDSSSLESGDKILNDSFPAFFSPYVVTRRGKKEARKEQQIRRGLGYSPKEIPTKDTVMQSLNISIEEEKRTSQYFRCLLESETKRLKEQCDIWTKIVSTENPPEEAQYIVQQAVGQTKLLLAKKFKRFEGLVLDCEKGNGQMLVTCKDLQGFWDIVNMEIKNCEDRFQKLENLKTRGWIEEDEVQKPVPKKLVKKKSPKKKSPKKSPKKAAAKSSLRTMILAARQKKKEIEEKEGKPGDQEVTEIWKNVVRDSPTKVASPMRKSSNTPQRLTSKERRTSFPLAVMAISQKCKTPEKKAPESKISLETQIESEMETDDVEDEIPNVQVRLDESISYINSRQTPGKSILKRVKVECTSDGFDDSRTKSTQKVIFNDKVELNEVDIDEEESTKSNLAAALARIDSLEFESEFVSEMEIRAEKKLNFEDESFNEAMSASPKEDAVFDVEEPVYETMVVPKFRLIPPTPKSPRISKKKKLENSILEGTTLEETIIEDEETTFIKTLRNRTVIGNLTPRSARKLKDISDSANHGKSPKINRENSTVKNDKSEEKTKTLDLNESLKQSSRSSKETSKSPKLIGKSPRRKPKKQAPSPPKENQDNNEEESPKKTERARNVSSPKETKLSRQESLHQNEETKSSEGQEGSEDQNDHPSSVVRFVKIAARSTSLLYKMIKSPKSASKRAIKISKSLEEMRLDSETESVNSPAKKRRSILKRGKNLKRNLDLENKTKLEEEISKVEMQVDENLKSEKKSSLSRLLATPNDLSPRRRRKNAKGVNKSSVDEADFDNSGTSTLNGIQVNGEKERELSTRDKFTDSDVENDAIKQGKSRKHRSTGNILNEKNEIDKDSKGLNLSLKESKIPKLRRSERIPESEVLKEKENETPSKRKSIRRSMSCHMAECAMGDTSSNKIQRSKSSGLVKTPAVRRTLNLMSFDTP